MQRGISMATTSSYKLKPYGLPIHGRVDGFSRRIMWLKVCKSNNDPVIPASLYLHAVDENRVRPMYESKQTAERKMVYWLPHSAY